MRRLVTRLLDDQRMVVGLGLVVAVATAAFVVVGLPKSAAPPAANAEAQVLLDTRDSQLVTAGSTEVVNLPLRATLVADLVASNQASSVLARDAHIAPSELTVIPPSSVVPPATLTPLTTKASPFAAAANTPYVVLLSTDLLTSAQDDPMPVISIETQAPDLTAAMTLANATASALESVVTPRSGQPATFVVRTVSAARRIVIPHSSRRPVYAVVGGLLIFVLWYAAARLGSAVARRRRPQLA